jgi:spermidine synthase
MNKLSQGWFSEISEEMWPGQCLSLEVESVLFDQKSDFQHVLVFKSKTYGNVLVLDGVIQVTERDEFSYQEMITHIPMCAHPDPKKVLVVGGGDGGVLREICKHKTVEEIHICEIDGMVIDVAKKFFPTTAVGFEDPRVKIHVADGVKYLEDHTNEYDIIIVDSSDPIGPAKSLFEVPFYAAMRKALRDGGIVCTQAECLWLHLDLIKDLVQKSKELYNIAEYAYTTIPTYPSGQIGFCICSLRDHSTSIPQRSLPEDQTRYYNPEIHRTAFVLPTFAKKALNQGF